jgi:glutamyl-tRNA synthetase
VPLTRIAPTPSGFLHEGNRVNFRRTADLAREIGAAVALRIDDADATRYRKEYAADIFATLRSMGIEWTVGPRDVVDFEAHWSQRAKTEYYRSQLQGAIARGMPAYACACSRTQQRGPAVAGCAGDCRARGLPLASGVTALRVVVDPGTEVDVGGHRVDLGAEMGDFIVWRRDDLPAYQVVSVVEDRDLGVTHIVRGIDLLPSSAAQIHLATWFDATNISGAAFVHHELVTDASGAKLSKSQLAHHAREETQR